MQRLNSFPGEDALNDALSNLRIRGTIYCRADLRAPWAICIDRRATATFHVVAQAHGVSWLEVEGMQGRTSLAAGDLVVLPHGNRHTLRNSSRTKAVSLQELLAKRPLEDGIRLVAGGRGRSTLMFCGGFAFYGQSTNPLIATLPTLIHVRGRKGRPVAWLSATLKQINLETQSNRPGARTLVDRLADVLFIQTVRAYFNDFVKPGQSPANKWLAALKDPQIGLAISLIHRSPETGWNVAKLASQVGMSRSAFFAKFRALVGEPPLKYVLKWRLHKTAWLLESSAAKLADIAGKVGYNSEVSLARAFRRAMGVTPGAYRRGSQSAP